MVFVVVDKYLQLTTSLKKTPQTLPTRLQIPSITELSNELWNTFFVKNVFETLSHERTFVKNCSGSNWSQPCQVPKEISLSNIWPIVSSIRTITFHIIEIFPTVTPSIFRKFLKLLNCVSPVGCELTYQTRQGSRMFFLITE